MFGVDDAEFPLSCTRGKPGFSQSKALRERCLRAAYQLWEESALAIPLRHAPEEATLFPASVGFACL
jgi:hypothetical protein